MDVLHGARSRGEPNANTTGNRVFRGEVRRQIHAGLPRGRGREKERDASPCMRVFSTGMLYARVPAVLVVPASVDVKRRRERNSDKTSKSTKREKEEAEEEKEKVHGHALHSALSGVSGTSAMQLIDKATPFCSFFFPPLLFLPFRHTSTRLLTHSRTQTGPHKHET